MIRAGPDTSGRSRRRAPRAPTASRSTSRGKTHRTRGRRLRGARLRILTGGWANVRGAGRPAPERGTGSGGAAPGVPFARARAGGAVRGAPMQVEATERALREAASRSIQEFTAVVRTPHLVLSGPREATEDALSVGTLFGGPSAFARRVTRLVPLEKRPGSNPFELMITVGRAGNNDIIADHASVSKFHAYFCRVGDRWAIVDAGSLNGTFVDAVRLRREERRVLHDEATVRLGDAVVLSYLEPASLYWRLNGSTPGLVDPGTGLASNVAGTR